MDTSEFLSPEAGGYLQVLLDDTVLYRSPSLQSRNLPTIRGGADAAAPFEVELPGGRRGRAVGFRFTPGPMPVAAGATVGGVPAAGDGRIGFDIPVEVTLCLARDTRDVDAGLASLRLGLIAVGAVLAGLLSFVISYGVSRGMRPVHRLAAEMNRLDRASLDRAIDVPDMPRELTPIVEQFNGLLVRLQQAFESERSFSADVSHELRTPLAGLRTNLEVTLARPRTQPEYDACLRQLLDLTKQMQSMVEALLHLASLERGHVVAMTRPVNIDEELENALHAAMKDAAGAPAFSVHRDLTGPGPVRTDPALLSVVLRNVLHNALVYVDEGGTITLATRTDSGMVEARVSNTGSRVAAADAPRVFDRFWRGDRSRARGAGRFGLGLALARVAVAAIGGTIHAESRAGGEFTICIRLPSSVGPARDSSS
jgi:signal transduction histidine kinase